MRNDETVFSTTFTSIAVALAVLLIGAAGCNVGFEGDRGNLEFNYGTDDFSPKRAVAVESEVQLRANLSDDYLENQNSGSSGDSTETKDVEVTAVSSNNSSVFTVEQFAGKHDDSFVLAAKSAGTADISVDVQTPDGTTVSDGFTLEAKEVDRLELSHPCEESDDGKEPVYLTGQTVAVRKTMYGPEGEELTGRGYNPAEVSGPSDGAELADPAEDANLLNVATGDADGTVTVSPTVNGSDLKLEVVDEANLTSLEWFGGESTPSVLPIDEEENKGVVFPTFESEGRPVCKGDVDLTVESHSPEVCEVEVEHIDDPRESVAEYTNMRTTIGVTAKRDGTCGFDARVEGVDGDVAAGAEIETSKIMK